MAVVRDRPYASFNFLVDIGTGQAETPLGGFSEVSGLSTEVTFSEYRNGNAKSNSVTKIPGLHKVSDITLKRGLVGSLDLYEWLEQIRNGDPGGRRTVMIQLQSEDHTQTVQTWRLSNAWIVRHTSGPLHACTSDVAMEEIVLTCERLEIA